MIALPSQLFVNTQIPACLWFLAKQKSTRNGEVLFIDARKLGTMISRVQIEFSDVDIQKIADTVHTWRVDSAVKQPYVDVPGFCKGATLAEIASNGHVPTPGRYVGSEAVEDDDEPFHVKFPKLVAELENQFQMSDKLTEQIRQNFNLLKDSQ